MSPLALLADVGGLLVSMWAAYVLARFITGYPAREVDGWEPGGDRR